MEAHPAALTRAESTTQMALGLLKPCRVGVHRVDPTPGSDQVPQQLSVVPRSATEVDDRLTGGNSLSKNFGSLHRETFLKDVGAVRAAKEVVDAAHGPHVSLTGGEITAASFFALHGSLKAPQAFQTDEAGLFVVRTVRSEGIRT
jgi:hypothetical protein